MGLALYHHSGAYNFELIPRVFGKFVEPVYFFFSQIIILHGVSQLH
jgi:hypothetical protein